MAALHGTCLKGGWNAMALARKALFLTDNFFFLLAGYAIII